MPRKPRKEVPRFAYAQHPRADEILHLHRKGYSVADIVIYTETKASQVLAVLKENNINLK